MRLGGPRPAFALLLGHHQTLLGPRLTDSDHYRPEKSPGEGPIWKRCSTALIKLAHPPLPTSSLSPKCSRLLRLRLQRPVSGPHVTPVRRTPTAAVERSTLIPTGVSLAP